MSDETSLTSLVAVIDHGSIAAAADATGYSPAAVSRHISLLEREYGVPLFERTGRSARPSVLARSLAERARVLLDEKRQFDADVRALTRGEQGVVRVAYFRAVGTTLIPPMLALLSDQRPDVQVHLIECRLSEDVVDHLRRGDADLGFTWGYPEADASGLVAQELLNEALVLCTSADRDDLHENPADLHRLANEPFGGPMDDRGSMPHVDRMFVVQGLPAPTIVRRSSDHAMMKSLVAAGVIVTLLPALGVSDPSPGVRRSIVLEKFRRIYLTRPSTRVSPLVPLAESVARRVAYEYSGFGVTYTGDVPLTSHRSHL